MKRVLVACEYSGIAREAFRACGWDAWSCDLLPTEQPGQHYQCDVREILGQKWDAILAHPDCTYITNSGVRWLDRDIDRWKKLWDAGWPLLALTGGRSAAGPIPALPGPLQSTLPATLYETPPKLHHRSPQGWKRRGGSWFFQVTH